jgi:hypothetical protein
MNRIARGFFFAIVCWSFASAQMQPKDEMFGFVSKLEGKSREARSVVIKAQLKQMNVGYFTVPFNYLAYRGRDTLDFSGEDIVARLGSGNRRLVVGAHFDVTQDSPGANSNGSGVAVVLELIKSMKDFPWKCTVDFVFFDQEEKGLLGSQFYIQKVLDRSRHYGMINLDTEGSGSEVYVGPVGGGDDNFLMPFLRRAAKQTGVSYKEHEYYPSSDYESFAVMRLENISISVVPKGDADLLARMTKAGGRIDKKDTPEIMKVIHTPNDRMDKMSPDALGISYTFTKAVLQNINDSIR